MKRAVVAAFVPVLVLAAAVGRSSAADSPAPSPFAFDRIVVDADFPGGYQVETADVDGDGKLDVVGLGGDVCAWYQNPSWRKRIITDGTTAPGVISSAAVDVDHDGKAEIALAYDFEMNQPTRGKLLFARLGASLDAPWVVAPVADVASIHRIRWGDLDGDGRVELLIAPIFGPASKPPTYDDPARIVSLDVWTRLRLVPAPGPVSLVDRHVAHAVEVLPSFGPIRRPVVLVASNQGVALVEPGAAGAPARVRDLVPGASGDRPRRGASEVHRGRFKDGRMFLATVEPWHGTDVVVWPQKSVDALEFGPRTVIDDTLADGHALWVVDLNGDGQDEVLAGHRGKNHRVALYDLDAEARTWRRTIVDSTVAAQDLRGGDLNGDGKPDVVAIGGSTHNVVLYQSR